MRPMGHIFLWGGFLSAAFWSVFQLELSEQRWMTVPWPWYAASMMVGGVGVALLRIAAKRTGADVEQTESQYLIVRGSLEKLLGHVRALCQMKDQHPSKILHHIDTECVEPLAQFADARQALIARYGLQVYADVMTEFASGERYLNRAWSAAADGYIDEVNASLQRSYEYLQRAQQQLDAAS